MRVGFIPIDNRPVCYTLPQQIAAIDKSIELFLPPRDWLGNLTKPADIEKIFDWLKSLPPLDAMIISLDTPAYGGLIPSRRCNDSFEQIAARLERLKKIIPPETKIYAFSSIMRISNNNINEEEKEYWAQWGKKIFEYSFNGGGVTDIPAEILEDYLATRKRNFEVNKIYLEWDLETLVFSKDDCAERGFNIDEARELEALGGYVREAGGKTAFFVKTGADEIPLSLLARAITAQRAPIRIAPVFLEPEYKHLISNYEDVSIEQSVKSRIELAGCTVCAPEEADFGGCELCEHPCAGKSQFSGAPTIQEADFGGCEPCEHPCAGKSQFSGAPTIQEADLLLYVNNFIDRQGEIVMGVDTAPFSGEWEQPDKPYMFADVRFANGADNAFVEQLFAAGLDSNFYGYCAWNTSANTLGSLICAAVVKFTAQDYDDKAFKRLQLVRFLDDWAYQANVRQGCGTMKDFEPRVFKALDIQAKINYIYPWNRSFEIEVNIEFD